MIDQSSVLCSFFCSTNGPFFIDQIDGFLGKDCEIVDLCFDNPCQNNGTCLLKSGNVSKFECICEEGFSGLACEVDVCSDNPCLNNGTCIPINGTSFECDCDSGLIGPLCKTRGMTEAFHKTKSIVHF